MRPSGAGLGNMSGQECTFSFMYTGQLPPGQVPPDKFPFGQVPPRGNLSGGQLSGGKLSASLREYPQRVTLKTCDLRLDT